MSRMVNKGISILLTYISAIIFVLAVFSVPVSVGPIFSDLGGIAYAEGCDEGEYEVGEESECSHTGSEDDENDSCYDSDWFWYYWYYYGIDICN